MEKLMAKTNIRIKRVKPSRSRCILWLRKQRIYFLWEPIPVSVDEPLDTLFWFLLREGFFPYEDSIFQNIDILLKAGCSVQAEPPKQQNSNEFELILNCCCSQGKPIFQIRLKLLLQDSEATMYSFLTEYLPIQYPFYIQFPHASSNHLVS